MEGKASNQWCFNCHRVLARFELVSFGIQHLLILAKISLTRVVNTLKILTYLIIIAHYNTNLIMVLLI